MVQFATIATAASSSTAAAAPVGRAVGGELLLRGRGGGSTRGGIRRRGIILASSFQQRQQQRSYYYYYHHHVSTTIRLFDDQRRNHNHNQSSNSLPRKAYHDNRSFTTKATTGESRREKRVASLPASLNSLGLKYLEADQLREQFDKYDINKDGHIDESEAVHLLVDAGMSLEQAREAAASVVCSLRDTTTTSTTANNNNNKQQESQKDSSGEEEQQHVVNWTDFKAAVDRAAEPVSNKVWPISVSLLLNFSGQGVTWPILPLLARSVGLGASELGIITGSSAFARICANVPAATVAEKVGRKPLLVMGPMVGSLGYLGYALGGDTFEALVASSALTGIGGAMTSVGSGLFLSDISTPLNRARTMSPLMTTALLGFAIGPAVGGFLAETYSLHTPFLVTATGMGCASLAAFVLLPETKRRLNNKLKQQQKDDGKTTATTTTTTDQGSTTEDNNKQNENSAEISTTTTVSQQWMELFRLPSIQGISSVAFMSGVVQGSSPVTTILFATETLGMSPATLGGMFCFQILAMSITIQPATALSDKFRTTHCRSTLILPGLATSAIILGIQPFTTTIWTFAGLGALRAVGDALCVMPNVTPYIMDNTTQAQRSQALAIRNMSQDIGILLGATTLGALAQYTSVPTAMLANATLQTIITGFFYNRSQHSRKEMKQKRMKQQQKDQESNNKKNKVI